MTRALDGDDLRAAPRTNAPARVASDEARPFNLEWARTTRHQCRAAGVAFFMKQTGSNHTALYERTQKDRAGADPAEWPEDLRVQEFPKEP